MDAALPAAADPESGNCDGLQDCIAEAVGLIARAERAADHADREQALGDLELLICTLEELSALDVDPVTLADADAVLLQAVALCHAAVSEGAQEGARRSPSEGAWSSAA